MSCGIKTYAVPTGTYDFLIENPARKTVVAFVLVFLHCVQSFLFVSHPKTFYSKTSRTTASLPSLPLVSGTQSTTIFDALLPRLPVLFTESPGRLKLSLPLFCFAAVPSQSRTLLSRTFPGPGRLVRRGTGGWNDLQFSRRPGTAAHSRFEDSTMLLSKKLLHTQALYGGSSGGPGDFCLLVGQNTGCEKSGNLFWRMLPDVGFVLDYNRVKWVNYR